MPDQLADEVQTLRSEARRTWAQIGQLLDKVESSRYWEGEGAASFSSWLRALAESLGRKERIFWRYLSAVRYYREMQKQLEARKIEAPTLAELAPSVSPGHVELLCRLAQVAPREVVGALAERVVTGQITRTELEQVWQTFRPALGGRTARGRGVSRPRIDSDDPQQRDDLLKAAVLLELQSSDAFWQGIVNAVHYEVLRGIRSEPVRSDRSGCSFDAVGVVYPERGPFLFHGIEYVGMVRNALNKRKLIHAAAYCDYLWGVGHMELGIGVPEGLPDSIGLLVVKSGEVRVLRQASCISRHARHRDALQRSVLRLLITRRHY